MTFAGLFGFIAMVLATGEAATPPVPPVRVMTIQQQMILRVPVRPYPRTDLRWDEEKGPRCLPVGAIAGAMLSGDDSIDIVLRNRQRIRARLENACEGLDFYGGFYLQTEDGRFCARRDVIRSRMGGTCQVEKFRLLVARVER